VNSSSPSSLLQDHPELEVHPPPARVVSRAYVKSMDEYNRLYNESIQHNEKFWSQQASELIQWNKKFTSARSGAFKDGSIEWFNGGELNASVNCIDRHLKDHANKVAIIWESDSGDSTRKITFQELSDSVNQFANSLKSLGVVKGAHVCIYMPMVPEAVIAMLACARIGAVHSVVFAGFSQDALRDRIVDGHCEHIITADEGRRGGKKIPLKSLVNKAIKGEEVEKLVKNVIVYKNTGSSKIEMVDGRDRWWDEIIRDQSTKCEPANLKSSDPLFMLYTSGSTGKPKGIVHALGGYLTYVTATTKYFFDLHDDDIYACVADVGWITGHSYMVYGPLSNGATTLLFEGIPTYPTPARYWEMIEKHKISVFYTSPTAVRTLMKSGEENVKKTNRQSLRIIGSVGEPINAEAWRWLYHTVGEDKCSIVDTYWQTETGGIIISPLPGATPQKPGSCTKPFFGIQPVLLDEKTGKVIEGNDVSGLLAISDAWPGLAKTIYGDHERFVKTYFKEYPGYYITGDGARRDRDGYYWITGRVDDVINVSGHRIGSAEVESALLLDKRVSESAVIGIPHETKGSGLFCFVIGKDGVEHSEEFVRELILLIRTQIGPFAAPEHILISKDVPKTRSGKIMRRLLRKIAVGDEEVGDISTLADPAVVERLQKQVKKIKDKKPLPSKL